MPEPLPKPWTIEDFLAWEAQQEERYEFIDGRIIGMVGGTVAHTIIKSNVYGALRDKLKGKRCRALTEGLKVVTATGSHYPDATVTCADLSPGDDQLREPVVIVEVLSRTTADRDRGAKWVNYQEVASLRHYVLVAQDRRRIDLFSRSGTRWTFEVVWPPQSIDLPAIGIVLTFDEIYEDSGT